MGPSLKELLAASYSCIALETSDAEGAERKVRDALIEIDNEGTRVNEDGEQITPKFGVWTITDGLVLEELNERRDIKGTVLKPKPEKKTFSQALDLIKASEEAIAIIFHNPRSFLIHSQHANIQLLIDTARSAREKFSSIIFVGQSFELAPELFTVVQFCDFPLPTRHELVDMCLEKIILPNLDNLPINAGEANGKAPTGVSMIEHQKRSVYNQNKLLFDEAAKAASGLDPQSAENAFSLSLVKTGTLDANVIQEQKRQAIRRTDVLEFIPLENTMDDIGGFDNFKQWMDLRKDAFTDEAVEFGVTPPKGVLLVGLPGAGKSLAAKASASALHLPLLRFDMSKVFSHLVGSSEQRMRGALTVADAIAPCVLWLDELEKAIAGSRSDHDSGVSAHVLQQLLTWRQESKTGVFLCATSNNIAAVPPEFYRPGRMDAIFGVGLPDVDERQEILSIHLRKRKRDPDDFDLNLLSEATNEFTGAEIELAVIEAIFVAYKAGCVPVTTEMVLNATKRIVKQQKRNKEEMQALEIWMKERAMPVSLPKTQEDQPKGKVRAMPRLVKKEERRDG